MGDIPSLCSNLGEAMPDTENNHNSFDEFELAPCHAEHEEEDRVDQELRLVDIERERVRIRALSRATEVAIYMPVALFTLIAGCILTDTKIPGLIYALAAVCFLGFFAILASGFPAVHRLVDRLLRIKGNGTE